MFDRLSGIETRYYEIERLLADQATLTNYGKVTELAQERAEIEPIVTTYRAYKQATHQREDAESLAETDPELREMAQSEAHSLIGQIEELEARLKALLLPKDPRDA